MLHAAAAEFDVLVDVIAEGVGDVQEDVLRGDAAVELAGEIIADGFAELEPRLAGRGGVDHVGRADAARGTVERATAARVGIGADEYGAGQRISVVGDDDMSDADIGADVVEALDVEPLDEFAPHHMGAGADAIGSRRAVIENDDDLLW